MKALDVLGTGARQVIAGAAKILAPPPASGPRTRDPFYSDERRAEIDARGSSGWLGPRRRRWLLR